MERQTFHSDLQYLPQMLQWVRDVLQKRGHDKQWIKQVELATEEALVNVIEHAYPKQPGSIEIGLSTGEARLELTIRDWGIAVNPLASAPSVDINAPLSERTPGGLGIYLMHKLMDEVAYHRESGSNVLTLIKHFSRKP